LRSGCTAAPPAGSVAAVSLMRCAPRPPRPAAAPRLP
jgi:hypothetical protein